MRILEQQNDEEEQEKGETTTPGTGTDPDAGTVTAPPPPPPAGAAATGGADPSGQAADPSRGHHSLHSQKRAASPGSHGSAKRIRTGSQSSCTTTSTSNFMPPLYYTTLNKRENAITPRVLGGGENPLVKGRFGTFTSDPRHTLATYRHIFDKGINISTSFDPNTLICTSCLEHTHPVLQRGGRKRWPAGSRTQMLCAGGPVLPPCPALHWGRGMPCHSPD